MNSKRSFAFLSALVIFIFALPCTRGQVIYANLGAGPYTPLDGYLVGGATNEVAVRFQATATAAVDFAEFALFPTSSAITTLNVALMSNSGSNTPGTILESTTLSLPFLAAGSPNPTTVPLTRAEFSNTTVLSSGTFYWMALSPAGLTGSAWERWGLPLGLVARDGEIGFTDPWSTITTTEAGGLRVIGVAGPGAVPEPATYGLAGGLLLLGFTLRRRLFAKA